MLGDFTARLEVDLVSVFFAEYAEPVTLTATSAVINVIMEHDVEIMDDSGTLDIVANAITVQKAQGVKRGVLLTRAAKSWVVGRILEKSPDGLTETWEITANG